MFQSLLASAIVLVGLGCGVLRAQPAKLPQSVNQLVTDQPSAQQFSMWLLAFNTGDRSTIQSFFKHQYPARLPNLEQTLTMRGSTGGFDFVEAEQSTPMRFAGLLQERASDQMVRFVMEVESTEPHLVKGLTLSPVDRPKDLSIARLTREEALKALRERLVRMSAEDRFAGAVLVAKDGKTLYADAYGMADRQKGTANGVDTKFRVGSMGKMFTAVAILQLVQKGKVGLDEPIGKYLADYPNREIASRVTIHQLLTHTGGTGDIFGPTFVEHRLELRQVSDYIRLYGEREPEFEPGTRWAYSNYGYLLLGRVIERVTGQDYYAYVHDHIYKLAGMRLTGSEPEVQGVRGLAVSYRQASNSGWTSNTETLPYRGTPAGGGYSTVGDLLRFANALQNHKLLNAKYTSLLTAGKVEATRGAKYAYGFYEQRENGVRFFGHDGGAPGMSGMLKIFPDSGYVVAVLSNLDPPAANRIADFISARLPDQPEGRLVDIGNHVVFLRCTGPKGRGSPTLVLEAGEDGTTSSWTFVQSRVEGSARVCSYDRVGLGQSDHRSTGLRTVTEITQELHAALSKAGELPPYILVGHSLGGILVRRFTAAYPLEIRGLVLVASAHEEQNSWGIEEARLRDLPPPPDPFLPAGVHLSWSIDLPMIVIEAGVRPNAQLGAKMHEMQLDLARRSTRGELRVAGRSGHMIQLDQPEIVVQAIGAIQAATKRVFFRQDHFPH
jgi:CubicO group peptidase (beta-lactamase class C family)